MMSVLSPTNSTAIVPARARDSRAPRWQLALLATVALAIVATTIYLKFNALFAWRYTSDLFTTDVMLQETLKGHFAVEFTYGCQFGDHACLITLAALPLKWLLGKKMVYALILVSPLTFLACGAVLFAAIRAIAGSRWALFAGLLYFLSLGAIRGPFEIIFGFHIDTIAGFIAIVMAALLLWRDHLPLPTGEGRGEGASDTNTCRTRRNLTLSALFATLLFVLLKEEMALLAIGFFTTLLLFKRDRLYVIGLLFSIAVFAAEMALIHHARSPWNRTNERLLGMFFTAIRHDGLRTFLFAPHKLQYVLLVLAVLIGLAACFAFGRRLNRYAVALALMGLAKLGFGFAVNDPDPFSWHSYPGFVMLTGAVILQCLELRQVNRPQLARIITTSLLILAAARFIAVEIPYARHQHHANLLAYKKNNAYSIAMQDLKQHVPDKTRVIAIPRYSAVEWTDGWRIAFFPHGITQSPQGIAEYMVITRAKERHAVPEMKVFAQIYQNRRYKLLQRKKFLPGELESHALFVKHFGLDSIGPEKGRRKK